MIARGIERGRNRVAEGGGGGRKRRLAEQRGAGWSGGCWHWSRTGGGGEGDREGGTGCMEGMGGCRTGWLGRLDGWRNSVEQVGWVGVGTEAGLGGWVGGG